MTMLSYNDIHYLIRRSHRARRASITVHHTKGVIITLPLLAPSFVADRIISQRLPWIVATQKKLESRFKNRIIIKQSQREYQLIKYKTLLLVLRRLDYYNTYYKLPISNVRVKNLQSRWGSCSSKANLNFNYSLIHLPERLVDYVVVHELCHIKELNHGPDFWNLVAQTIPDYQFRRQELKEKYLPL